MLKRFFYTAHTHPSTYTHTHTHRKIPRRKKKRPMGESALCIYMLFNAAKTATRDAKRDTETEDADPHHPEGSLDVSPT